MTRHLGIYLDSYIISCPCIKHIVSLLKQLTVESKKGFVMFENECSGCRRRALEIAYLHSVFVEVSRLLVAFSDVTCLSILCSE